jgi:site-specific recombinase XerD
VTLASAIAAFVDEKRRLGYAKPGDLLRPLRLLHRLVTSRLTRDPDVIDLRLEDLFAVLDDHMHRGLSESTRAGASAALRGFTRFLLRRGYVLLDPGQNLVVSRPRWRAGYIPTQKEVSRLLLVAEPEDALSRAGWKPLPRSARRFARAAHDRKRDRIVAEALRDHAILELLYGSGLRSSEVFRLDVKDVDLRDRTAFIRRAKGQKDRVVPITKAAASSLSRYLGEGREVFSKGKGKGKDTRATRALFLLTSGARLSRDFSSRGFRRLVVAASLPKALTPHRLRHACAVHLLTRGADIVAISRLLGHTRLDVTAQYLALDVSEIDRALLLSHPRERRSHRVRRKDDADSR